MSSSLLYVAYFAFALPYLAIVVILVHNKLRRARWQRGKNLRRPNPARCSTSAALGAMLMVGQVFYRPSLAYGVEARERIDVDEDDPADPKHPDKALIRQLRRIRRGEPVGDLVWRL